MEYTTTPEEIKRLSLLNELIDIAKSTSRTTSKFLDKQKENIPEKIIHGIRDVNEKFEFTGDIKLHKQPTRLIVGKIDSVEIVLDGLLGSFNKHYPRAGIAHTTSIALHTLKADLHSIKLKLQNSASEEIEEKVKNTQIEVDKIISESTMQAKLSKERFEAFFADLTESKRQLADIKVELEEIKGSIEEKLIGAENTSRKIEKDFRNRLKTLDSLLGAASERTMAQDYQTRADSEEKTSDHLRYASIGFMLGTVSIAIYSLLYLSRDDFLWESLLAKLFLGLFLTIPAAYLARESAKHRQQQYMHLQTALDLKAIDPFLRSIPEEEQHKIKAEIANKLFIPKEKKINQADSFPLNSQELLMKLLDKVDLNPKKDEIKNKEKKEASATT